ncbi:MAG: SDR family oxidoreductase [Paracoccaceae bacterium]|nr:SDR family oxidoreductase [Paracoccaceae bacterium]
MTTMRLKNKTAVVTAAGQGIGRATAERLRDEGASVFASDLQPALLDDFDGVDKAGLDATDPDAVAAYMARFERIDVLVHAVGYVHQGTIEECSLEDWRRSATITLDSAFHVLSAAIPKMKEHGGSIVCIASVVSSIKGLPKRAAYGAMKAGVIGLTKSVACDYLPFGIRCNAVCPATVDTPSLRMRIDELAEQMGDRSKAEEFFIQRQPTGRFGTPEEIAGLCAYLASEESNLITGQAISIDGGIMI